MDDGTLERRALGAEQLMTAKITEFAAHLTAGDRSAAERARTEALAALEVQYGPDRRALQGNPWVG